MPYGPFAPSPCVSQIGDTPDIPPRSVSSMDIGVGKLHKFTKFARLFLCCCCCFFSFSPCCPCTNYILLAFLEILFYFSYPSFQLYFLSSISFCVIMCVLSVELNFAPFEANVSGLATGNFEPFSLGHFAKHFIFDHSSRP